MSEFFKSAVDLCTKAGSKIILALVVFIIGRIVIKKIVGFLEKREALKKVDPTVGSFATNFIKILLHIILILSVIGILGVPMASVVTVLATAGLAVGMSLQGALSNLAGGIMLLIFRPFNVGDYVQAGGEEGTVRDIALFYTVIMTNDNRRIIVPNGTLMNSNVTNFTAEGKRRVDLVFSCGKGEDIEKVQKLMTGEMEKHEKVLKDPAPFARFSGGTNESMEFTVRAWCSTADYWDVYFDLLQNTATEMGKAGISAPAVRVISEK